MRRMMLGLLAAALLAGCQAATTSTALPATVEPTGLLTPYRTPTSGRTATIEPSQAASPTLLPSPTPTPRTHTVSRGEDLFGIALRYQVTLDALMQLNPTVEPHLLLVGTVLQVPAPMVTPVDVTPQPTAIPIQSRPPDCWATADEGAWCFLLAENNQEFAVESITAVIRLAGADGDQQRSQTAFALLNHSAPGGTIPLAAYFPPPGAAPQAASAEITSALPVDTTAGRYLPVDIQGDLANLQAGGRAGMVTGTVRLNEEDIAARQVWVAAAGYDEAGRLIGMRRWESGEVVLQPGETLKFEFPLYSQGGPLVTVQLWAEAQP